jgi:hypothetical protein
MERVQGSWTHMSGERRWRGELGLEAKIEQIRRYY